MKIFSLANLLALLTACGTASAQNFSSVVVFGDSLSDSGNISTIFSYTEQSNGPSKTVPLGSSFTTNPDPVWAEIVAERFGHAANPSRNGGTNFAWGGACASPNPDKNSISRSCVFPVASINNAGEQDQVPAINDQVDAYLTGRGGVADPNSLFLVWAGGNDVEHWISQLNTIGTQLAASNVGQSAKHLANTVTKLKASGARHVAVLALPDPGGTAYAQGLPNNFRTLLSSMGDLFNKTLFAELAKDPDGIIPLNANLLYSEILAEFSRYGFTSATGTACEAGINPAKPNGGSESLVCGVGNEYIKTPRTNEVYLFADGVHPSGKAHQMIANALSATVAAPVQVSVAGEPGIEALNLHRRSLAAQMTDPVSIPAAGTWRGFALGSLHSRRFSLPNNGRPRPTVS